VAAPDLDVSIVAIDDERHRVNLGIVARTHRGQPATRAL
jgi:hypothetical protein